MDIKAELADLHAYLLSHPDIWCLAQLTRDRSYSVKDFLSWEAKLSDTNQDAEKISGTDCLAGQDKSLAKQDKEVLPTRTGKRTGARLTSSQTPEKNSLTINISGLTIWQKIMDELEFRALTLGMEDRKNNLQTMAYLRKQHSYNIADAKPEGSTQGGSGKIQISFDLSGTGAGARMKRLGEAATRVKRIGVGKR